MGDDEFFSSAPATVSSSALAAASSSNNAMNQSMTVAARNPLTIDEITRFSKQLMNIVFLLYWREDLIGVSATANEVTSVQSGPAVPGLPNLRLEAARERMTKLLQAIHAREYVPYSIDVCAI